MGVLLVVRHGQASFGADDYDVLSDTGWEQARTLGRWLGDNGPVPDSVVHGGMRRHRETWQGIAEGAGWGGHRAEVDADWDEFDHVAVLEHHQEVAGAAADNDDRRAFQSRFEDATGHWAGAPPGSGYPEPYDAFVSRTRRALERATAGPGVTLVVTSGGVIAALAATLVLPEGAEVGPTWSRFNTVIANASVTRVIAGGTGVRLLTFNEHPHLRRALLTYR